MRLKPKLTERIVALVVTRPSAGTVDVLVDLGNVLGGTADEGRAGIDGSVRLGAGGQRNIVVLCLQAGHLDEPVRLRAADDVRILNIASVEARVREAHSEGPAVLERLHLRVV